MDRTLAGLSKDVSSAVRRQNRTYIDYYWIDTNEHADELREWVAAGIDVPSPPYSSPTRDVPFGTFGPQLEGWSHDIRLV